MKGVVLVGWVALGLAMLVVEVVGLLSGRRFPTLGDVLSS